MPDHYFEHPEDYTTMFDTLKNTTNDYLHIQESLSQGGWLMRAPEQLHNVGLPFQIITDMKTTLKHWSSQIESQQNILAGA